MREDNFVPQLHLRDSFRIVARRLAQRITLRPINVQNKLLWVQNHAKTREEWHRYLFSDSQDFF